MEQQSGFVTLGELLDEKASPGQENEILDRLKLLAQESLPNGWTRWEVSRLSKEEIFGEEIKVTVDKLEFALPTVGMVRAFDPEADHLSEKGYQEIKTKLLDWAFTRALIMGPPAIANKIRGSAKRTEMFKEAVEPLRPMLHTITVADGILSKLKETTRKRRRSSTSESSVLSGSESETSRLDMLEDKLNKLYSCFLSNIEAFQLPMPRQTVNDSSNDFRPKMKETVPLIPEPTPAIREQGIKCQRFGSKGWNSIPYKEVEQRLHAAPVFSALKINAELGVLGVQPSTLLTKQDHILGTISHGLLLQRKALADGLREIANKCPSAAEDIKKVLSKGSQLRAISDDLLQFVCGLRAETIEQRRLAYITKNETLSTALRKIPPSTTHIFDEKALSSFLKDNREAGHVFQSKRKVPIKRRVHHRKPAGAHWHVRKWLDAHSAFSNIQQGRSANTDLLGPRRAHQMRKPGNHSRNPVGIDK